MRIGQRTVRKGFAVMLLGATGIAVASGFNARSTSAADADLFGLHATVQPSPMSATASSVSYGLASGVCSLGTVPGPVSTQLPGYMDVISGATGTCTLASGSGGTLTVAYCSTGSVTAQWQIAEPASGGGKTVAFNAAGVMVGGVAVLAAPPLPALGTGYWDPIDATSPGTGSAVALFLPDPGATCPASGFIGEMTAAVVGVP